MQPVGPIETSLNWPLELENYRELGAVADYDEPFTRVIDNSGLSVLS